MVPPTAPGRRRGLGARPHAAAPSRAVQRGDAGLPGADPPGPRPAAPGSTPTRPSWPREVVEAFGADPVPGPCRRTRASPTCRSRPRRRPPRSCGGSSRRAIERFCLAIGTAEPRKDLPGPGARLRRAGRAASPTSPWSWPDRRGGASRRWPRPSPRRRPRAGSSARAGWTQPDLAALLAGRQRAGLPLPLRGVRVPAAAGHAGRGAGGGDPGRFAARGARATARCWSSPAITTALVEALAACLGDEAERAPPRLPPARPGRRATHGSAAATGSRRSIAMRRQAVAETAARLGAPGGRAAAAACARRHRRLRPRPARRPGRCRRRRATRST